MFFKNSRMKRAVMLGLALPLIALVCARTLARRRSPVVREASLDEIADFFRRRHKRVLTFLGYSGNEYERPIALLRYARQILAHFDPAHTIVNIGATQVGIGAIYPLAKRMGFVTTGIVSTRARKTEAGNALSHHVDFVFFVQDDTWGGYLPGTEQLSPTSAAMVGNSDVVVAIGGDDIARDELRAAKHAGRRTLYIAADMNHAKARRTAQSKGMPEPTDFTGAAADASAAS
jgi:hypothetical protein